MCWGSSQCVQLLLHRRKSQVKPGWATCLFHLNRNGRGLCMFSPARPVRRRCKVYQQGAKEYLLTDATESKRQLSSAYIPSDVRAGKGEVRSSTGERGDAGVAVLLLFSKWHNPLHSYHSPCSHLPHPPSPYLCPLCWDIFAPKLIHIFCLWIILVILYLLILISIKVRSNSEGDSQGQTQWKSGIKRSPTCRGWKLIFFPVEANPVKSKKLPDFRSSKEEVF